MIEKLTVVDLNNKFTDTYLFNKDLNILSGRNGSGKTTLLKLMWYMTSGNLKTIFEEMTFTSARLDFSDGDFIELLVRDVEGKKKLKVNLRGTHPKFEEEIDIMQLDSESFNVVPVPDTGNSLFFPTFRRIEGGFSTTAKKIRKTRLGNGDTLKDVLQDISNQLSYDDGDTKHLFITSIATSDITNLLSGRYSKISQEIQKIEEDQSKQILSVVANSEDKEKQALEDIRNIVSATDAERNIKLKPFSILSKLVDDIFQSKSIRILNNIQLGKAEETVSSEQLSAGEKQMLSFLCYNFFYDNAVLFIDEPELSLHTDWQRILFPTLLKQGKNNQFIIATHSPFIYTMYPDKEILLDDRGEANV